MTGARQMEVREYLASWLEEDWEDLLEQVALMPLPAALVAVHRRKLWKKSEPSPWSEAEPAAVLERAVEAKEQIALL